MGYLRSFRLREHKKFAFWDWFICDLAKQWQTKISWHHFSYVTLQNLSIFNKVLHFAMHMQHYIYGLFDMLKKISHVFRKLCLYLWTNPQVGNLIRLYLNDIVDDCNLQLTGYDGTPLVAGWPSQDSENFPLLFKIFFFLQQMSL